jgi:hypothetical protein
MENTRGTIHMRLKFGVEFLKEIPMYKLIEKATIDETEPQIRNIFVPLIKEKLQLESS